MIGNSARPPTRPDPDSHAGQSILVYLIILYQLLTVGNKLVFHNGGFTYFDELAALVLVPLAVMGAATRRLGVLLCLTAFSIYLVALLVSAAFEVSGYFGYFRAAVLAGFLDSKVLLWSLALYELVRRRQGQAGPELEGVLVFFLGIGALNSVFVIIDVVFAWNINGFAYEYRNGLRVPYGLFWHKVISAHYTFFAMVAAGVLAIRRGRRALLVVMVYFAVLLALHVAVKETFAMLLVSVVLITSALSRRGASRGLGVTLMLLLGLPGLVFVGQPLVTALTDRLGGHVVEQFGGSSLPLFARAAMYVVSWQIAVDRFPFGSGGGTFASNPTKDAGGSPVLQQYGLDTLQGLTAQDTTFLMDVFWPKVLAEAGFLGLFGYAMFLAIPLIAVTRSWLNQVTQENTFALSMLIFVLVVSIAHPIFTQDDSMALLALALALVWNDGLTVADRPAGAGRYRRRRWSPEQGPPGPFRPGSPAAPSFGQTAVEAPRQAAPGRLPRRAAGPVVRRRRAAGPRAGRSPSGSPSVPPPDRR